MFDGKSIRLRALTKDDLSRTLEFMTDESIMRVMFSGIPFPRRLEDEEKWYDSWVEGKQYYFGIECKADDTLIGTCGIFALDAKNRIATVVISVGSVYQGNGYGTEALQLLVDFCFNEANVNKLNLSVYEFNERAIGLYQKAGFQKEATLRQELFREGRYWDVYIMGLLREEWAAKQSGEGNHV